MRGLHRQVGKSERIEERKPERETHRDKRIPGGDVMYVVCVCGMCVCGVFMCVVWCVCVCVVWYVVCVMYVACVWGMCVCVLYVVCVCDVCGMCVGRVCVCDVCGMCGVYRGKRQERSPLRCNQKGKKNN